MPNSSYFSWWIILKENGKSGLIREVHLLIVWLFRLREATAKLLSDGSLRATAVKKQSSNSFNFLHSWATTRDIFKYYDLNLVDNKSKFGTVESIDFDRNILTVDRDISKSQSYPFEFPVTSDEEVPVIATRLVTQTKLREPLPLFEMRLGTTKGTNALLERSGASVVFLVTKGHKDLLEIGYQQRPDLFALNISKPRQLYQSVVEVEERIGSDGKIICQLKEAEIERVVNELKTLNAEVVAICFLHAYLNPLHEKTLKASLLKNDFKHISISSEISPTVKIIPRAQATVVNAYLDAFISSYLNNITKAVNGSSLKVMTSAGGLADKSYYLPKDSLLSGPAANGVISSGNFALTSNYTNAFNQSNNTVEDIFALQVTAQDGNNGLNRFYAPAENGGRGDIDISPAHEALYDPADDRLNLFYTDNASSRRTGKWTNGIDDNINAIRLAEMYLVRAEANFRNGSSTGATPVADINTIRARVNLPALGSVTLADIMLERKLELAFEGFGLADIRRQQLTLGNGFSYSDNAMVFPIPEREIETNTNLTQNPGY